MAVETPQPGPAKPVLVLLWWMEYSHIAKPNFIDRLIIGRNCINVINSEKKLQNSAEWSRVNHRGKS